MRDERLPDSIYGFEISDDGVLSKDGMNAFPWYTKQGHLGGTVRYRLVADSIEDMNELFQSKTQENSE
jgi:hypothetical protein